MNNKQIGTAFEKRLVDTLASLGYWVHFMSPDARGAQPFDVIAVKYGLAHAIDCKTCKANSFSIKRLEDNQIMAFEKWKSCENLAPEIAIEHNGEIYMLNYDLLKVKGTVPINDKYMRKLKGDKNECL